MTQSVSYKKVLITGASGFLGRHCIPLLLEAFDEVHSITNKTAPSLIGNVHWHRADLRHVASVSKLISTIRPTHLLHLAWVTEHGQFWNSPENVRWLNGSSQLVQSFAECGGRRVVTAGTCAEYGIHGSHCYEMHTPCSPTTLYGACKHALRLAAQSVPGLSAAHSRIFHLYGPHEDTRRLTPSVIQSLILGRRAACTHGEQVRDFMYVQDAAAAHVRLLQSNVQGPVNVASGHPITIKDFVSTIGRMLNRAEMIDFGAMQSPAADSLVLTADTTLLGDEIGFRRQYSLEQGLSETIRWHQTTRTALCPTLPPAPSVAATQPVSF